MTETHPDFVKVKPIRLSRSTSSQLSFHRTNPLPDQRRLSCDLSPIEPFLKDWDMRHRKFGPQSIRGNQKTLISPDILKFLLLGSTGCGKSATGNFLTQTNQFLESADIEPCTQAITSHQQNCDFFLGRYEDMDVHAQYKLNVIDTPGLNNGEEGVELANTQNLIDFLSKIEYVSMVLICLPYDIRPDRMFVENCTYYKHLLKNIFDTRNWGVMITRLPAYEFESQNLQTYLKKKTVDFTKIFGIPPPHIFFFNHQEENKKYQEHNTKTREEILKTAFLLQDQSMKDLLFPLPPNFEQKRIAFRKLATSVIQALKERIMIENIELTQGYEQCRVLQDTVRQLSNDLEQLTKSAFIKVEQGGGTDLFHFWNINRWIQIPVPIDSVNIELEAWGCVIEALPADKNQVRIFVDTNLLTWKQNSQGYTWFWRATFSVDGSIVNQKVISELETNILDQKEKLHDLLTGLNQKLNRQMTENPLLNQCELYLEALNTYSTHLMSRTQIFQVMKGLEQFNADQTFIPQEPSSLPQNDEERLRRFREGVFEVVLSE